MEGNLTLRKSGAIKGETALDEKIAEPPQLDRATKTLIGEVPNAISQRQSHLQLQHLRIEAWIVEDSRCPSMKSNDK